MNMESAKDWWDWVVLKVQCLSLFSPECQDFLKWVSYGCLSAGALIFISVLWHYYRWRQKKWNEWMAEQQKTYVNELEIKERRWVGEDNPAGLSIPEDELKQQIRSAVEKHRLGNGRVIT